MDDASTADMVASLRHTVAAQAKDLEEVRRQITDLQSERKDEVG
jgi:hypothetical protein